jgi:hypothetical protein
MTRDQEAPRRADTHPIIKDSIMKRILLSVAAAGIGLVPAVALADTDSVKVDGGHTATIAKAGTGASRDIPSIEDILAMVAKSKPASLTAPDPKDMPPAK